MKSKSLQSRMAWGRPVQESSFPVALDCSESTVLDISMSSQIVNSNNGIKGCLKVQTLEESLASLILSHDGKEKQTRFSTLEIRDYPRMLGDNPSTTRGPPLTLQWKYSCSYFLLIDTYEQIRPPRREKEMMMVPKHVREEWLMFGGYSRGELKEAELAVLKARKDREASAKDSIAELMRKLFLQPPVYHSSKSVKNLNRRGTSRCSVVTPVS